MGCEPGMTQSQQGKTYCDICPAGTFIRRRGSTQAECNKCKPGQVTTKPKSVQCENCEIGTFAGKMGLSVCTSCDNGTASSSIGASECTTCGIGSFAEGSRATECTLCTADQYTLDVAAVSCMSCAEAGIQFALSEPNQCSTANTIIVGSVVGGVLVVVVVALVLIMVLVKKPAAESFDDGDGVGGDGVLVHASYLTQRGKHKKTGGDFDDDGSYAEPGSPDYLPQPPRPDARGEPDAEVVRTKKAKVVPTKKKNQGNNAGPHMEPDKLNVEGCGGKELSKLQ